MLTTKKLILLVFIFFVAILITGCEKDLTGMKLEDIDIEAVDVVDIPAGAYTIPYTIDNLNEYVSQFGISVSIAVVDGDGNEIDVSDSNNFNVEADKVYTVTIDIMQSGVSVKRKQITVTAIDLPKLSSPENLSIYNNEYISFNQVDNATSYKIWVNGTIYDSNAALYDIESLYDDPDEYTIKVKAQANGYEDSDYSESILISTVIQSIALNSTPATNYVEGAYFDYGNIAIEATYTDQRKAPISTTACLISIPNGTPLQTTDVSLQITHSQSGKSLNIAITVIPLSEAVWTVTFNGNGGNRVDGGLETQQIEHNNAAIAPEYTWKDHLFLGFDTEFDAVKSNITVTAQWLDLTIGSSGLDYALSNDYTYYSVTGYWGTTENVVIPSVHDSLPVLRIGNDAFRNNNNVRTVYIPQSVNSIGVDVFDGTNNLHSINVSEQNEYFASVDGVLYDKSLNMLIQCPIGKSGIITIPDGVQSIGSEAFAGCMSLTNIIIPDSVYDIADRAFFNTSWYNNQADGIVYAGKVAYKYKGTMPEDTILELASDTVGIAGGAFEVQDNLSEIVLTNGSLKVIGNYAFNGCDNLNYVLISDTIIRIGVGAFKDCTKLKDIYIPDTLDDIGQDAFKNTLWYNNQPDGVVYAGNVAIAVKGTMPESVILQDGTLAIGDGVFSLYEGNNVLENIHIPDTVVRIGSSAFNACRALTKVFLPNSVAYIGMFAFYYTQLDIYAEVDKAQEGWDRWWNPDPRPVVYNAMSQAVTFTFETDEGTAIEPITAVFLSNLPISEKEGYNLHAWYDNPELSGAPVSLPYYNKNNTVLYSEWYIKTYFVQFDIPDGWTHTGGGNLIQIIAHGSNAAAPIINSGDETFVAWDKGYTDVKENLYIVPIRVKLLSATETWATYVWLYAENVGADLEIDMGDGKGFVPLAKGAYKPVYRNCTISARASYKGGEYVSLPDFVVDNIDASRPSMPMITYIHDIDKEGDVLVDIIGGIANGASEVTHSYRLNNGDWQYFNDDAIQISIPNGTLLEARTGNEAQSYSAVNCRKISIDKVIFEDLERYVINDEQTFSSGERIKYTGLKNEYDSVNKTYYDYRDYNTGDPYEGCGVKAAEIFVNWFGANMGQTIVKDYVETTNVGWLDSWIFTTPAQMEDGIQDILDDEGLSLDLSRRSLNSTSNAVTWIQNQLAAGYPVIILSNDGDHWQVITEATVTRNNQGDITSAMFMTHDNGGSEWRTWGDIDYFFEDNWSAKIARFFGYDSYRDTLISVLLE